MGWMKRPTSAVACVNSCVVWMEWPCRDQFSLVASQTADLTGTEVRMLGLSVVTISGGDLDSGKRRYLLRTIGRFDAHLGVAGGPTDCVTGTSPYLRLSLLAEPHEYLAFGFEVASAITRLERLQVAKYERFVSGSSVWHFNGLLRLESRAAGVRPFASVATGIYVWDQSYLGYRIAGGLRWTPRSNAPPLGIEVSWHANLQHLVEPCPPEFLTVSFGTRLAGW